MDAPASSCMPGGAAEEFPEVKPVIGGPPAQAQTPRPELSNAEKCSKFLRSLLHLANQQQNADPDHIRKVSRVVEDLIAGRLVPETFTEELRKVVGSTPQPKLIPFLKAALPSLRSALLDGSISFDFIDLNNCAGPSFRPEEAKQFAPSPSRSADPAADQTLYDPPSVGEVKPVISASQENFAHSSNGDQVVTSTVGDCDSASPVQKLPVAMLPENGVVFSAGQPLPFPGGNITLMTADGTPVPTDGAQIFVDEKGNVLQLEPRPAFAPSLVPEQLPALLLDPHQLAGRVLEQMNGDCAGIEADVFVKISQTVESKLRELLKQLATIAEHRLEPVRLNPMYTQVNEPRRQLRFIEEVEKQAFVRRQNIEREALLKFSKSKTKDKDTVQKAKEIQRANQEEHMNREANEAAIAALGGRGLKRAWGISDALKAPAAAGLNLQMRPRTRRVVMKDFLCALNGRGLQRNNLIKFLVAYGLVDASEQQQNGDVN